MGGFAYTCASSLGTGTSEGNRHLRVSLLNSCLLVALGVAGIAAQSMAATVKVSRCDDLARVMKGGYSFRQAVGHASDGDIVDMSGLSCPNSKITLALGEVETSLNALTIQQVPPRVVSIDGGGGNGVLDDAGNGSLILYGLDLTGGVAYGVGGCVRSSGDVLISHTAIHGCSASSGGGVSSLGTLTVLSSSITSNTAQSGGGIGSSGSGMIILYSDISNNVAQLDGGGIEAIHDVTFFRTTIAGNQAVSGRGGGIYLGGVSSVSADATATVTFSSIEGNTSNQGGGGIFSGKMHLMMNSTTVAGNHTNTNGGGIDMPCQISTCPRITISNSTLSGNVALDGGGIFLHASDPKFYNSTIASNSGLHSGAGVYSANCNLSIVSSILSNNSNAISGTLQDDIVIADPSCHQLGPTVRSDIIVASTQLMPGVLRVDPHLGPLDFHGGFARVHPLLAGSVAIDTGESGASLTTDERGVGFPRVQGLAADIGAYEVQPGELGDEIFADTFD